MSGYGPGFGPGNYGLVVREYQRKPKDLGGMRVGRLRVVQPSMSARKPQRWVCKCDCGEQIELASSVLLRGKTKSCGCDGPSKSHGRTNTLEYSTWLAMRKRCENPKADNYERYGGRGIKVCERWKKFKNFYADMGMRPSEEYTIDRIDNDRGYEPGNCRWATYSEQNSNKRRKNAA